MQKSMRKLLSLLLTLAMLLSMPLTALAEEVVVSEEPLPIVEEVAASEATESAELPSVEVPVTEEVVIEEVLVEEVPAVEEAPVVEAVVSAPVAVLAAVEEEAVLMADPVAMIGETTYETLDAAIAAAVEGLAEGDVTIELLGDAEITAEVEFADAANELTITIADSVAGNVTVAVVPNAQLHFNNTVAKIAGLSATQNIVFDGTGQDAYTANRPLYIRNGADVTLDYVTFKNITVSSGTTGGVARLEAAKLTCTNSTFTGNTGPSGGFLYCSESAGTLVVDNCVVSNNKATISGGAGAIQGRLTETATITNTKFIENSNTTGGYGTAMRIYDGTWTIENCEFTGHSGAGRATIYMGTGSSNASTTQNVTLKNCEFTDNSSNYSGNGGEIYMYKGGTVTLQGTVTMSGFDAPNQTLYSIYSNNTGCKIILEGCTAELEGIRTPNPADYANATVTIADPVENGPVTLSLPVGSSQAMRYTVEGYNVNYDYTATVNDADAGMTNGVFELDAGSEELVIKVSAVEKETPYVAQVGSVGYETLEAAVEAANELGSNTNIVLLKDITYTEPTTIELGGKVRLYVDGGDQFTISGPLTLTGKEDATRYVAYITGAGSKLTLDGVTIDGYVRPSDSTYGALRVEKEAELVLNNVTAKNVQACRGVVYVTSTGTKFTATNCTFENNTATAEFGGAISTYAAPIVTLTGCTFKNNTSATYGGAFATINSATVGNYGAVVTMTDCVFENNTSGTAGGAIRLARATATLTNCTFTGNTAGSFGDDICISGSQMALTLAGTTSAADLEIYDDEAVTIKIAEGASGAIDLSFTTQTMHEKHYADAETPLPLFAGDGFAAAYAAGKITLENKAYSLLDTGYLKLKGIASVDGVYYPTVTDAIMAVTGEGTVVLANLGVDIVEEILTLPGVTLDLNGQTIVSTYPIIYNGSSIIDSTDGAGKLVCAKNDLVVPTDNKYLPIWVDEPDPGVDYYCFTALDTINTKGSTAGGTYTYITRPEFNEDIAAMLGADGAAAHGLKVKILLKWDDSANTGYTEELPLVYTEDDVKAVYADNKAFYAYVTNYANYVDKSLEISVQVVSDTGVKFTVPATAIQE